MKIYLVMQHGGSNENKWQHVVHAWSFMSRAAKQKKKLDENMALETKLASKLETYMLAMQGEDPPISGCDFLSSSIEVRRAIQQKMAERTKRLEELKTVFLIDHGLDPKRAAEVKSWVDLVHKNLETYIEECDYN